MKAALLLLVIMIPMLSMAEGSPEEVKFHNKVVETYNFEPHLLDETQIEKKSADLDGFWEIVKADPERYLPLLRQELSGEGNPAFFYYDGSKLLIAHSDNEEDLRLALGAIPRANLLGIDSADYVRFVAWLAGKGLDTHDAAFRVLDYPEFRAFFPQHALTLGKDYALVCMLFPLNERIFLPSLVDRLRVESNPESQKALLLSIWYTVTPEGDDALNVFIAGGKASKEVLAFARKLSERKAPPGFNAGALSENELRKRRREVMARPISDEALMEFDALTGKLIAKAR